MKISLLANYFVAKASRKCNMRVKPLSAEALACLVHYDWPGNVRELENALERALVLGSTDSILPDDLPETVLEADPRLRPRRIRITAPSKRRKNSWSYRRFNKPTATT